MMNEREAEVLIPPAEANMHEANLVCEVLGIDPDALDEGQKLELDATVAIVKLFSRNNPYTGAYETISPSRIAAIPLITARHCKLKAPARGELNVQQIYYAWATNMPANDGTRMPDQLFDITQLNFGTDEEITPIVASFGFAERQRETLWAEHGQHFRHRAKTNSPKWYDLPLDADDVA